MAACNSLFYHPTHEVYATPRDFGLDFQEDWFTHPDGTRVHAWHIAPQAEERRAVIVHFHGNAQNMSSHFLYVAWLAQLGFNVVTVDYRGYGRSDGVPSRQTAQEDALLVLKRVHDSKRYEDYDVFVWGQSLGGAVAIAALGQMPKPLSRLRGVIAEACFDSYRWIARAKLADFWMTWPLQWPLALLVSDDSSPIDSVSNLTAPLLLVFAKDDPIIPFSCGERLFEFARVSDKRLWVDDSAQHLATFAREDENPWRTRLVDWLCAHRGPGRSC